MVLDSTDRTGAVPAQRSWFSSSSLVQSPFPRVLSVISLSPQKVRFKVAGRDITSEGEVERL